MGGHGSGRRRTRRTTDSVPKVDIRDFKPGHWDPKWVSAGWSTPYAPYEEIDVECTPTPFGGYRGWFLCQWRRHRAMILYKVDGKWVCRRCGRLVYPSSREHPVIRAMDQAHKARERIGGPTDLRYPATYNFRPKGMWQRTWGSGSSNGHTTRTVDGFGQAPRTLESLLRVAKSRCPNRSLRGRAPRRSEAVENSGVVWGTVWRFDWRFGS